MPINSGAEKVFNFLDSCEVPVFESRGDLEFISERVVYIIG